MRLVDADRIIYHEIDEIGGEYEPYFGCSKDQICNLPTIEAIPVTEKAFEMFETDYKNRLKADMVAMLEEFDSQFDKICFYKNMGEWKTVPEIKAEYKAIIREKINELKGDQDE